MADALFSIQDKVIVLTGGLGRLGKCFQEALSQRGARVAVFDRDVDAERWEENVAWIAADVTSRSSLEGALARLERKWGPPAGLVNNAAIDSPPDSPAAENGPFEDYPESSFDRVMNVNVKGVVLASQVIGGRMAEAGHGSVINISSIYGVVSPDQRIYEFRRKDGEAFYKPVAYSVSKSALMNLTRYLAAYWAERGVRVNTMTLAGVFDNQPAEFLEAYCPKVPLGRMAEASDYVGAVIYLLSDASRYMTGSNMVIDGGYTAW
jgi:NAD(P)-dependent dehydrogenase (short-subunit alcohol dehydrogenase family)